MFLICSTSHSKFDSWVSFVLEAFERAFSVKATLLCRITTLVVELFGVKPRNLDQLNYECWKCHVGVWGLSSAVGGSSRKFTVYNNVEEFEGVTHHCWLRSTPSFFLYNCNVTTSSLQATLSPENLYRSVQRFVTQIVIFQLDLHSSQNLELHGAWSSLILISS